MIELAQAAFVDEQLCGAGLWTEQCIELNGEFASERLSCLVHDLCIGVRTCHWFFAVDVHAGLHGCHCHGPVEIVVQADVYGF